MKIYYYLLIIKDKISTECYFFDDYDKMMLHLDSFEDIDYQTYYLDFDIEGHK